MVEFRGSPKPLPHAMSRNLDDYELSHHVEVERVIHAEGYEEVTDGMPRFGTPEELIAWVDGKDYAAFALAIYCGNWLIAYRGNGYWVHLVEGRPEVYVAGLGSVDMISVAEDLLRGNGRVFRYIASV